MTPFARFLLAALIGLALTGPAPAQERAGGLADDPLSAEVFEVRYRALTDAADVVSAVLSEQGSLTLKPRLHVLVVEDRRSVLDRVRELLEGFDLPPRNVEVTFTLILGIDVREDEETRSGASNVFTKEVGGVLETLGDFTKWHAYEPIGSRSVTGVEGREVRADLTEDYRIVFLVDSVHETRRLVNFERVVLQRLRRDEQGRQTAEDLYTTGMVLKMDRLHLVGAASGPQSERALFLAVQVAER